MKNVIFITLLIFGSLAQEEESFRPLISLPTMGWRPSLSFSCDLDCKKEPIDCLNELLYVEMADILFSDEFRKSGYTMIQVDDCADERVKGPDGKPIISSWRFPTGIRFLSNYFHERGLEFAINQNKLHQKCLPSNQDSTRLFLNKLMELRTDMVEMDMCDTKNIEQTAREMMVFCDGNQSPNQKHPPKSCDIYHPPTLPYLEESWESLSELIDQVIKKQDELISIRRSGKLIDFGELLVGSQELTHGQWRIQMSIWSIWSTPLMISVDLRSISRLSRRILLNHQAIDINQDELGEMGRMVMEMDALNFFTKRIEPCDEQKMCSYAVAIINRSNRTITTEFKLSQLGIPHQMTYQIQYVWNQLKFYKSIDEFHQINVTKMDAQMFTIIPFLNGKLYEKQIDASKHSKKRRKDNKKVEESVKKSQPTIEWVSQILSLIVNLELIWLCGIGLTAAILFMAVKIDRKRYRLQNAPKLIRKTSI